jgi:hypothetical protein
MQMEEPIIPTTGSCFGRTCILCSTGGYLTVTPDYAVEVSRRLKDEFDNGREYYALQGKKILLPDAPAFRPSPNQLAWHNEHVYRP